MKLMIFLITLFPTTLMAQLTCTAQLTNTLGASRLEISAKCDDNACNDLFSAICKERKTHVGMVRDLNNKIEREVRGRIPANATLAQKNDNALEAIQTAEKEVFGTISITRDDLRRLMDPAKWNVIHNFNGMNRITTGTTEAERVAKERQIASRLQSIGLRTGSEYIKSLVDYAALQDPRADKEKLRSMAIEIYMSACGRNGLNANAFYEDGVFVMCPGLVWSLKEYNAKGEEIKAALIFTMSHEMAHSLDYLEVPEIYGNLKSCYETVLRGTQYQNIWQPQTGAEITSDYFGAYSLGKYLKDNCISGSAAIRIIAMSADGWCEENTNHVHNSKCPVEHSPHPPGQFRVNQTIRRVPSIREALGCSSTSQDPACTLAGQVPPRR